MADSATVRDGETQLDRIEELLRIQARQIALVRQMQLTLQQLIERIAGKP
jgi:hypothetical protein